MIRLDPSAAEPALGIVIDDDLVVRWIQGTLPPRPTPSKLRPLDDLLAKTPVGFSVRLGACRLALGDLSTCVPGDVLVLDRSVDAPLEAAVNHQVQDLACRLIEADGAIQVVIS